MPGNASMTIFIGADNSDFLKKMNQTERAFRRGLGNDAIAASEGVAAGLAGLAAGMGALSVASVKMAGDMRANKKAFEVFLGSAEEAERFLNDLAKFASETPFELKGLTDASKKLLAFKFAAEDIIPIMTVIGDASGMLNTGQEGIDSMVRTIGQMQAKGKIQAEEVMQLAEAGINAWQYLATSMGVSVSEVMDKVSDGAVSAREGINAILLGMQKDFKGGMKLVAEEIPGLWSTILDNSAAVSKQIGEKLIQNLNITERMKGLANSLGQFAEYVKNSGINAALRDLVPKEATLAVFTLAGALTAVAIPALNNFAAAAVRAIVPLLPLIAAGALVGAAAWSIWQGWEPLGEMFKSTHERIYADWRRLWENIVVLAATGVQKALQTIAPLARMIGGQFEWNINHYMDATTLAIEEARNAVTVASEESAAALARSDAALTKFQTSLRQGINKAVEGASNLKTVFDGLHGPEVAAGPSKETLKAWDDLQKKAEQVTKAIEQEWVQTTKTELEQLDIWKTQQLQALEETKAANENYLRDIERVNATYSARRRKILESEQEKTDSIWDSAADAARNIQQKIGGLGLKGVDKEKFDIETDATNQIVSIQRRYRDWSTKYKNSTDEQKEQFRLAWEANGLVFKINANGMVDFSKQVAKEQVAVEKWKEQQIADLRYEYRKHEDELDQARRDGDIASFVGELNTKRALMAQDLAGRQEMIDVYYEMWKESHRSSMSYIAEGMKGMYNGLTTFFTDVISGTKGIGEAWADLGKTVGNMLARMVAQWIASRITMWAMEKMFGTQQQTLASTQAAAVASAWAPAAAMVSLATMGTNAYAAMAGMSLATGFAIGLSNVPGLATGGITTGPTLAEIGEGHRQEAVLPLDRRVFERMGLTNKEQPPAEQYHIYLQAWDGPSVDRWLEGGGGAKITKFLKKQVKQFALTPAEVGI